MSRERGYDHAEFLRICSDGLRRCLDELGASADWEWERHSPQGQADDTENLDATVVCMAALSGKKMEIWVFDMECGVSDEQGTSVFELVDFNWETHRIVKCLCMFVSLLFRGEDRWSAYRDATAVATQGL